VVKLRDAEGRPVVALSDTTVTFASDSPGGRFAFERDATAADQPFEVTIPAGASSASVFYGTPVAGKPSVTATASGLGAASHSVTVKPGPATGLAFAGHRRDTVAGAPVTFDVVAVDRFDNQRESVPDATLTIEPDGVCDGMACTATTAGPHTVTATSGALKPATAHLDVRPGPLAAVRLDPANTLVAAGAPQAFTVEGADAHGNPVPLPHATLSISPDGVCAGATCVAETSGPHTVSVKAGDVKASAELVVLPGPLAALKLRSATVAAGIPHTFTVEGFDAFGNPRPASGVTLDIGPDGSCENTTCTATAAGPHTVTARAGAVQATATLTVSPRPRSTPGKPKPSTPAPARAENQAAPAPRWVFTGFQRPLRNGKLNRVKRAVTLRWRLTDDAGAPITTVRTARLTVTSIPCRGKRIAGGGRARSYRVNASADGSYRLKWKPRRRDAGSCKRLRLELPNGIAKSVDVKVAANSRG